MTMVPFPMLLAAAMALTPLGPGQEARIAAWLNWAAAYRDCYHPAPFSLRIDEKFTASCIERDLRRRQAGPPEQRAATLALIEATPRLVALLNAPAGAPGGGKSPAKLDPPSR